MGLFRLQDTYKLEPKVFLNKTLSRFYPTIRKLNCNLNFFLTFKSLFNFIFVKKIVKLKKLMKSDMGH